MSDLCEKYKDNIGSFLGIDINEKQIEINKSVYGNHKNLSFSTADLTQKTKTLKGPNKIYMSFGGVLEYLTEKELLAFFSELASSKNSAFLLYEPIQAGFNFKEEQHSILYGSEFSFSHPYSYYLNKCGFKIFSEKLTESGETNWLYLASTTD